MRAMFAETRLTPDRFILPIFIHDHDDAAPIDGMPGQARLSVALAVDQAKAAAAVGVKGVLLFGVPARKDHDGSGAADPDGIVPRTVRAMRDALGDSVVLVADCCLCSYTDSGHCGITNERGVIDNARSVAQLAAVATTYATAGADLIAPSDMMDGRVAAIRQAMSAAGHGDTGILSYAAKSASAFYGPFRDAADCAPQQGDRRAYQLDPGNGREALRAILRDVEEGADAVIVKPAGTALDIIAEARATTNVPIAAYQVSGEFAALHAAAERGWLDLRAATLESLTAIHRAGADLIVTYAALDAARWLADG